MKKHFTFAMGFLFLGFASVAMAKSTTTTNVTITLPQVVPTYTVNPVQTSPSEPVLIDKIQAAGSNSYALFHVDTKKIIGTVNQNAALINIQLALINTKTRLSACIVGADINATGFNCGQGLIQFDVFDYYTLTRPFNLAKLPILSPRGVKEVFGGNFKSPVGAIAGDAQGGEVHIHFNVPVSQFMIHVDSGQPTAPSIGELQFVVSNGIQDVSAPLTQTLTAPTQFAGIQRASGFTDVTIKPIGGQSQAFTADLYSVVPKVSFIP